MVDRFRRRVTLVLLVLYVAFVCVVTLSPRMPGSSTVARLVDRVLLELHERGIALWVDYLTIEFLGNILMFIPLGALTAMLLDRRHWWALLILGTLFSGAIEVAQYLLLPARFSELRDVVSNTIGFLIGAILIVIVRMIVGHRDRLVLAEARLARP
jgi:glycopeptide antibiotics resistance protein